jgi:hypothetical protein
MDVPTTTMANDERDDESGKFASKYDEERFLAAVQEHEEGAGTAEVAETVGCPHSTAYHRLDQLRADGKLDSRQIGNAVLWVVADGE